MILVETSAYHDEISMFVVVSYDIVDDKRRLRLARELENWGQRAQLSVFECDLDETRTELMLAQIRPLVSEEDQIKVYFVCQNCLNRSITIGGTGFATDQDFYQV